MTDLLIRLFIRDPGRTQDPAVREKYGLLAGCTGLVCNLLLSAGKLAAGFVFGSIAIMADAVNNLSDASSCLITLVGFRLGSKPADREHPFGHARIEYLAGLSVALVIMAIGVELVRTSIEHILQPTEVTFSVLSVAVLAASILVKFWMSRFYTDIARRIDSEALVATGADSRNDVLSTGAVLACSILAAATGINLDGWAGLAVAAFILWSGVGIVKDTLSPLLGEAPSNELVSRLSEKVMSYDGVLGLHDLMVHDYGPGQRFASVHVEMNAADNVMHCHDVIDNIERDVMRDFGIHLVIHMDPICSDDSEVCRRREWMADQVKAIDPRLTIHDFRMVSGPDHTNLIFDVVVPPDFGLPKEQLLDRIAEKAAASGEKLYTVVTVDYGYAEPTPGAWEANGRGPKVRNGS